MFPFFPPIPPNPQKVLFLVEIAKKAFKFIQSVFGKSAEDAGKTDPLTKESTIEDIAKVNEIFNDFKESVEKQAVEIESKIVAEISEYADELCFAVSGGNSLLSKYSINLNRFFRQIEKLKSSVQGTIQKEVSKKVSLDNPECRRVVKMLPGNKKEEEFRKLFIVAINEGVEAINEKVQSIIADITDDFEFTLIDCIELIEKESNANMQLLTDVEKKTTDITEIKALLKSNANLILCSSQLIEKVIGEAV